MRSGKTIERDGRTCASLFEKKFILFISFQKYFFGAVSVEQIFYIAIEGRKKNFLPDQKKNITRRARKSEMKLISN